MPTITAIGVASPSAHGHATMSTATAFTIACVIRGSGPTRAQTTNVTAATPITMGTKYDDARSASRCTGGWLRCASPTSATICARSVPSPTRSAFMRNPPAPFTVPPLTRAPTLFSTGIGSPVSIDSSTALFPSTTTPSTGIFSPGRTRS